MTIDEILNLGHISSSEVPNYTRIQTEDGYYMTAWTEGDDIRKYAGSNVYYLPVRENYDYPDLRVITVEEHKRLSSERDAELEINPLVILLKPQGKEVLITSNGETIVTPDEGFNGLTEVNISVDVPIPIFETETLSVELTENGTYNYTPIKDGYSSVEVTVDVAGSGGGDTGSSGVDFGVIGYTLEDSERASAPIAANIAYSKSLFDAWVPSKTSTSNLYKNNTNLVYAPLIDTSKVTDMQNMFNGCSQLTYVPQYNTSKAMFMNNMFAGCNSLTTISQFDTSGVVAMDFLFQNCTAITSVPQLNFGNVESVNYMFNYDSLTTLGGFINFGKKKSIYGTNSILSSCSKLTHESIMNVINNLYDRATAGYSVLTLKLHANVLALLSDDDIAIATNKGWTLS